MSATFAEIYHQFKTEIYGNFAGEKLSRLSVEPKNAARLEELRKLRKIFCGDGSQRQLNDRQMTECRSAIENLKNVLKNNETDHICNEQGFRLPKKQSSVDTSKIHDKPEKSPDPWKISLDNQASLRLPKEAPTKAEQSGWAANIRRFSSTSETFSWNARYLDQLNEQLRNGAPSLAYAHTRSSLWMRDNPVVLEKDEAKYLNQKDKEELSEDEKKFFKPIEAGTYQEIPYNSHPAQDTGWLSSRKGGEVVIFVGARKKNDDILNFRREAETLKETLELTSGANVRIVERPSKVTVENHIKALGERVTKFNRPQSLVVFIGHGGSDVEQKPGENKKSWSNKANGSFWSREEESRGGYVSISESDVRRWMNTYVAPHCENSNLLLESCHSGSWIR